MKDGKKTWSKAGIAHTIWGGKFELLRKDIATQPGKRWPEGIKACKDELSCGWGGFIWEGEALGLRTHVTANEEKNNLFSSPKGVTTPLGG